VFIVLEKETEVKLHQFINGVSINMYWVANIIFDFGMYVFPAISVTVILFIFDVDVLIGERTRYAFFLLLFFFMWAMPGFGYILAHFFKNQDQALTMSVILNFLVGAGLFLMGFLFELIAYRETRQSIKYLGVIFRMWPVYAFGEGLWRLTLMGFTWKNNPPEDRMPEYWEKCDEEYERHERAPHECARTPYDRKYGCGD
jgi:hypothetical protein